MQGWEDMDPRDLDDAYANAPHIPYAASFPPRWAAEAAAFRAAARGVLDISYADRPGAALDLFHPEGRPSGLMIFVHGGYWRSFDKSDWSHFASGGLAAGWSVAIIGYPLAPTVRIAEITRLVSRAVDVAAEQVSGPIHLTGHSAGGHLVARLLMADVAPACLDRIAHCLPISPVADLRPLVPQSLNADWRLDAAEARAESPVRARPSVAAQVEIHVGAAERPSFLWQADALAQAWGVARHRVPGRHHFDVIETLRDPASDTLRALLGH